MLYSYVRLLLRHLPLDRDVSVVKIGNEVELQYYRLQQVFSGGINLKEGEGKYVHGPAEVGTGRAEDKNLPLSEIIRVLNERLGTHFDEEDRLFFQQIKEKACKDLQIINTALNDPFDKFQPGVRKLIEELMIERMAENDEIVTRYMGDRDFQVRHSRFWRNKSSRQSEMSNRGRSGADPCSEPRGTATNHSHIDTPSLPTTCWWDGLRTALNFASSRNLPPRAICGRPSVVLCFKRTLI